MGIRRAVRTSRSVVLVLTIGALVIGSTTGPAGPVRAGSVPEISGIDLATASEAGARGVPSPVRHVYPLVGAASHYGHTHHDYPATDMVVACGTRVLAPVDGIVWEIVRVDRWTPAQGDGPTAGGRTLAIDGFDGVRYWYAHLDAISPSLQIGDRVNAGDPVATVGVTGHTTGCHLHLGLSPPCPTRVWSILPGTIWPWPYLDDWQAGQNTSPADEEQAWLALNPTACDG